MANYKVGSDAWMKQMIEKSDELAEKICGDDRLTSDERKQLLYQFTKITTKVYHQIVIKEVIDRVKLI